MMATFDSGATGHQETGLKLTPYISTKGSSRGKQFCLPLAWVTRCEGRVTVTGKGGEISKFCWQPAVRAAPHFPAHSLLTVSLVRKRGYSFLSQVSCLPDAPNCCRCLQMNTSRSTLGAADRIYARCESA